MPPQLAQNLETVERKEATGETVDAKRNKLKNLVSQSSIYGEKDKAAGLAFFNTPQSQDPKELDLAIQLFSEHERQVKDQIGRYDAQLQKAQQNGDIAAKSILKYQNWWRNELSYSERKEYLDGKKKTELEDPVRAKQKSEFDKFNKETFPSVTLRKKFFDGNRKERDDLLKELKEKKKLMEGTKTKLPSVVRDSLGVLIADTDIEGSKKIIDQLLGKHNALKIRYSKLPPLVQEEFRETFKKMQLQQREGWIEGVEKKTAALIGQYRVKIMQKQQKDSRGLTLFSDIPEKTPGSSAGKYMDWFINKLTLSGMQTAVGSSDLDKPERSEARDDMAKILQKMPAAKAARRVIEGEPEKNRAAAAAQFNAAELDKRKELLIHYQDHLEKGGSGEKKGFFTSLLRRILRSDQHQALSEKTETWAIMKEVTKRRRLFRVTHNAAVDHTEEEAAKKGATDTIDKTAKFEEAARDPNLRGANGKIELKAERLAAHRDARDPLRRVLKEGIDNPHEQLSTDAVVLKTHSGAESHDEIEFERTELKDQLDHIKKGVMPIISHEMAANDNAMSDKQIEEQLKNADWEAVRKGVIKKES